MLSSYIIRGQDYLARCPNFELVGRDDELDRLSSILIRKEANSILLVGPEGVGTTALCMGLSASKNNPYAPFDIVNKRFFWLDTDGIFSSGDCQKINDHFQKILSELSQTPESVLIIEDTRDFIEGSRSSGNSHFINALTKAVKEGKTQVILEIRDGDLDQVFKWHSDLRESYTLMDLSEPTSSDLSQIVDRVADSLSKHHGIRIASDALKAAIDLTNKYRSDNGILPVAQPKRTSALLDRALASYRLEAHRSPAGLAQLRARNASAEEINNFEENWLSRQLEIKRLYDAQREGETQIINLNDDLNNTLKEEEEKRTNNNETEVPQRVGLFARVASRAGFESEAVSNIRARILRFENELKINRDAFARLTEEINKDLVLTKDFVVEEFSRISGIKNPDRNELEILKGLEAGLKSRVFGQDHALVQVANGIKVMRVGQNNGDKPLPYLFVGPSGVGKTEVAKVVAEFLLGDQKSLLRFDMSEYMEKHGVAKLIGAPPGYEGFEAGGILTNALRINRKRVILFDEIEKAHPDVFNVLLQVLDDGRLTDNVGRTAYFNESIIIMTSNIGQPYFLNTQLSHEEAFGKAMEELLKIYKPEFLNRFNGRQNIIGFNRLVMDVIGRIVRREIDKIDVNYAPRGFRAHFDDASLAAFCEVKYDPDTGARGLPGIIKNTVEPPIVDRILENPTSRGIFTIGFNRESKDFAIKFDEELS